MRLSPEYFVSGLIIIIGLLTLTFKLYYEPDKRINLKKASIYQGWALIIFGSYLLILKIILSFVDSSEWWWWPLGLVVGAIVFMIVLIRLKRACYIVDNSENFTFDRGVYQRR